MVLIKFRMCLHLSLLLEIALLQIVSNKWILELQYVYLPLFNYFYLMVYWFKFYFQPAQNISQNRKHMWVILIKNAHNTNRWIWLFCCDDSMILSENVAKTLPCKTGRQHK